MKSSELSVLAGGAAAALIAGVGSAALGLAPMRASLARYGAEATHIALRQSPDAADTGALQVAVSSSNPSPSASHAVTRRLPAAYVHAGTPAGDGGDGDAAVDAPADGTSMGASDDAVADRDTADGDAGDRSENGAPPNGWRPPAPRQAPDADARRYAWRVWAARRSSDWARYRQGGEFERPQAGDGRETEDGPNMPYPPPPPPY